MHTAYLYMIPTLAYVIFPFKLFGKFQIVTWYAHSEFRVASKLALRFFADRWVSVDPGQTLDFPNVRIVGQGVDTSVFKPLEEKRKFDLITVGRITPVKQHDKMLRVLKKCKEDYGAEYSLNIVGGGYSPSDIAHKEKIENMVKEFGLTEQVHFSGILKQAPLAEALNQAEVFFFLHDGGIGKATVEAMATGMLFVVSAKEASAFLSREIAEKFLCDKDVDSIAKKLHEVMSMSDEDKKKWRQTIFELITDHYTLDKFGKRVRDVIFHKEKAIHWHPGEASQ